VFCPRAALTLTDGRCQIPRSPRYSVLGQRHDIIDTIHRALADHELAEERGMDQYVCHGKGSGEKVVGRVIGARDWPARKWGLASIWWSMAWTVGFAPLWHF
jgi:hypothetical protein